MNPKEADRIYRHGKAGKYLAFLVWKRSWALYLIFWKTIISCSPTIFARQRVLNMNWADTKSMEGVLPALLQSNQAVMGRATVMTQSAREHFRSSLAASQYRHNIEKYLDDPVTDFTYPVFDSFEDDRQLAGVITTDVYWKLFFANILPPSVSGIICILENSFNQTLAYRIDGPDVTYLGEEDLHDTRYDYLEELADINAYVQSQARPETRSYTAVPLNKDFGKYTLRIYPSRDTEVHFSSNKPWVFTIVVAFTFLFTSIVFIVFAAVVERRQKIVMEGVVKSAAKTAATERELNEFLAHEVRNPLSAAMSALSFVTSAINETGYISNEEFKKSLQEDAEIVDSSLHFIDEFLRSMLDTYRAAANKLEVKLAPADLLKDVLEPVCNILYQRDDSVDVTVDCPDDLIVVTDCLRLKQIMINLGRNSTKFVHSGFIRFRAAVVDGIVELYVEDSGPGIPMEKRGALFEKFQSSLDVLSQGTGIGLSLCENLTHLLNGDIWLDETYDSGVDDSPGARFVIRLNTPPLPSEDILQSSSNGGLTSISEEFVHQNDGNDQVSTNIVELPENLSVLFVDDDRILRKLFSRSVAKAAPTWKIQEAANGETALRLADLEPFDLIFMDQYMASTEKQLLGTDTVRALRAKGFQNRICGLSANDLEQSFVSAGADFFMLKPIPCDRGALEGVLDGILSSDRHLLLSSSVPDNESDD
jgi:signal transduction histidine kinase/CheY-like chemotaxis protein